MASASKTAPNRDVASSVRPEIWHGHGRLSRPGRACQGPGERRAQSRLFGDRSFRVSRSVPALARNSARSLGKDRSLQLRGCGSRQRPRASACVGIAVPESHRRGAQRGIGAHRAAKRRAMEPRRKAKGQDPRGPRAMPRNFDGRELRCSSTYTIRSLARSSRRWRKASPPRLPPARVLVDLLYVNPTCADILTSQGLFIHLWTARIPMDAADQKADPYGTTSDLVSAYRLK